MWGLKLNVPWSLIAIQIPYCKSLKLLLPLVAGSRKLLVRELSSADSVSQTLRVSITQQSTNKYINSLT